MIETIRIDTRIAVMAHVPSYEKLITEELERRGYTRRLSGSVSMEPDIRSMDTVFKYHVTPEDILFKRFNIGHVPDWKKRKEILFRKF